MSFWPELRIGNTVEQLDDNGILTVQEFNDAGVAVAGSRLTPASRLIMFHLREDGRYERRASGPHVSAGTNSLYASSVAQYKQKLQARGLMPKVN